MTPERRRQIRQEARRWAAAELAANIDEAGEEGIEERYPDPDEAEAHRAELAAIVRRIRTGATR